MRYHIAKRFDFSAAHFLTGLPEDHPCSRPHGHNYSATLELAADELDETGFVVDYRELDTFKRWIDDHVDHRHLNHIVPFNPTAERLALWLFGVADEMGFPVVAVTIKETDKTSARYRPLVIEPRFA
jgi:6-pyruvoyltetrahydropterin/6-carboxytetrahydropterin synthase